MFGVGLGASGLEEAGWGRRHAVGPMVEAEKKEGEEPKPLPVMIRMQAAQELLVCAAPLS